MKAVMMNPAEPVREVVVECNRKDNPPDEVGKKATTYSGRTGGRIVITQELWRWIHDRAVRLKEDLGKKGDIINQIKSELSTGNYNGEEISLGASTIEKILSFRYLDLLKSGFPPEQSTMEHYDSMKQFERQAEKQAYQDALLIRKFFVQVYSALKADRFLYGDALNSKSAKVLKSMFPEGIEWPTNDLESLKELVKRAFVLQYTSFRMGKKVEPEGEAQEQPNFTLI